MDSIVKPVLLTGSMQPLNTARDMRGVPRQDCCKAAMSVLKSLFWAESWDWIVVPKYTGDGNVMPDFSR